MTMQIVEITDAAEKSRIAAEILLDLPEWFGLPDSTEMYIRESAQMPFYAALSEGKATGFIALKKTSPYAAEVYVMGVKKHHHRCGAGRALMEAFLRRARAEGCEYAQVKTVAAGHYEEYDRTRLFYEAMGFRALEVFPTLWDEWNPCLVMVMKM